MSALDRHPDPLVQAQFIRLRNSGWKVALGKFGNYWVITCKAGTMSTRITPKTGRSGLKNKTAQQQVLDFLAKHNARHPGER